MTAVFGAARLRHRIGMIVPSSNTTMETEIPMLLGASAASAERGFTYHSSRARLHTVDAESLKRMVGDAGRCALEVGDAKVEVVAYACLVALMAQGPAAHRKVEADLGASIRAQTDANVPIVSSAGALVRTVKALGLERVAIVAPYMPELTQMVISYIEAEGIEVVDSVSLSVSNNEQVGRLDPMNLPAHASRLDVSRAQGIVLSACVQMPSLPAVQVVQDATGLPVVTAATCTAREVLQALGLIISVPGAGAALGTLPAGFEVAA